MTIKNKPQSSGPVVNAKTMERTDGWTEFTSATKRHENVSPSACRSLTLGVVERVRVSADVALQVGVEAGRGGEEAQADGHQLPASLQAVVAEVLRGLATQLDVELVTEALVAPPAHHHLTGDGIPSAVYTGCVTTRPLGNVTPNPKG